MSEVIVDAHCHLWELPLLQRVWHAPEVLLRTFSADDLQRAAQPTGAAAFVLIEAGTSADDAESLLRFAESTPAIQAVIAYGELDAEQLDKTLAFWEQSSKFRGIRLRLEGASNLSFMETETAQRCLQRLAERALLVEFLVVPAQLEAVRRVVERTPQLQVAVQHMGKPDLRGMTDWALWCESIRSLAQHRSVYCKLSLGARAADIPMIAAHPGRGWFAGSVQRCVDFLLEQFGAERLMWGSDWPIVLLEGSYESTYAAIAAALEGRPEHERQRIFSATARQFYGIPGAKS